jgi:hypothetical protein
MKNKKRSESIKKKWADPAYRQLIMERQRCGKNTSEAKENCRKASLKRWKDPNYRKLVLRRQQEGKNTKIAKQNYSKASIKKWKDTKVRAKFLDNHWSKSDKRLEIISDNSKWHKNRSKQGGHNYSKDHMIKMAVSSWMDKDDHVKSILMGNQIKPNKKEAQLMILLNDLFPHDYKYTGDGKIIIGGKCPDFTNVNGQKKLVELFGDYWHKGEDPSDRINHFLRYGYYTLVIWERELTIRSW